MQLSILHADDVSSQARHRRPISIVVHEDGNALFVGNRRSGSVSVVDRGTRQVRSEVVVCRRLSALVAVPDRGHLLALDEATSELVVLRRSGASVAAIARLQVATTPVSVSVLPDGSRAHVASLWARRMSIVDLSDLARPQTIKVIHLPFAPREQELLPGGTQLVVASAFGGELGVIDLARGELTALRHVDGHNLRGIALSADGTSLLIPHQLLQSDNATTRHGVHWGAVMLNVIRSVSLEWLRHGPADSAPADLLDYLGTPDRAAGDPTGILVTHNGRQVVAFAGVSELGISDPGGNSFHRAAVGRGPSALALGSGHRQVYVANTFSDSISVVDVASSESVAEIPLGPQAPWSLADRGEVLFHDSTLSSDGWYSCHSCHTDGHSNGLLNDNFSDGGYGAPKRVLSLLGVAQTGPWAWNGKATDLEQQIRTSITATMQGPTPSAEQVAALAGYLKTLPPPPSVAQACGDCDPQAVARGGLVFQRQGCADCHPPPTYTSPDTYDVALDGGTSGQPFNPPSLRGVSQRERLFHDNRACGVRDVVTRFQHGLDAPLTEDELDDLLRFLQSL